MLCAAFKSVISHRACVCCWYLQVCSRLPKEKGSRGAYRGLWVYFKMGLCW